MKKQFYSEEELEQFIYFPENYSEEEIINIEEYIANNALAREFVQKTKSMRNELAERMQHAPLDSDIEFAKKLLSKKQLFLPPTDIAKRDSQEIFAQYYEIVENRTLPQRFIWYVRNYPIRTASFIATLAATVVLLSNLTKPNVDGNPSYAEVKDNVLTVYNAQGQILFTKPAVGTPNYNQSSDYLHEHIRPFLIADIDGDGINELLTNLYNRKVEETTNSLICYSNKGIELWRYSMKFSLAHLDDIVRHATQNLIIDFNVIPATANSKPRLFVTVNDPTFMPSCIVEIDPFNRRELHAYWHPGAVNKIFPYDINNDGKMELLIAGINNVEEAVFLAGINPDKMNGASATAPPKFETGKRVQEIFYCLLPPTQLHKKLSSYNFNSLKILRPLTYGDAMVEIETTEIERDVYKNTTGGIKYIFDKKARIVGIGASSNFEAAYKDYVAANNLDWEPLGEGMFEKLRKNVRYWDGEKFVNYPTFNRKYIGQ